MATTFYLVPRDVTRGDADLARDFLDRERTRFSQPRPERSLEAEQKKRLLVELFSTLQPEYREFEKDFVAIAAWEGITTDEARSKYAQIEMTPPRGSKRASFVFFDDHVWVQCGSGTSAEELDAILYALSLAGGFVLYDSQFHRIENLLD